MAFNLKNEPVQKSLDGKFRVAGYLDPLDSFIAFSKKQPGIDKTINSLDETQARFARRKLVSKYPAAPPQCQN